MKSIGSIVMPLASGQNISEPLANMIYECKARASKDISAVGLGFGDGSLEAAHTRLMATLNLCESPIEKMALAALSFTVIPDTQCFPPAIHDVMSGEDWPNSPFVIVPQFNIARYRLDFLISIEDMNGNKTLIDLECDGAEFHNGQDARVRDAARTAYLERLGIRTLRISGKQIYQLQEKLSDVFSCIALEKRQAA
jgi:very-short-patch-repair endonuclease